MHLWKQTQTKQQRISFISYGIYDQYWSLFELWKQPQSQCWLREKKEREVVICIIENHKQSQIWVEKQTVQMSSQQKSSANQEAQLGKRFEKLDRKFKEVNERHGTRDWSIRMFQTLVGRALCDSTHCLQTVITFYPVSSLILIKSTNRDLKGNPPFKAPQKGWGWF